MKLKISPALPARLRARPPSGEADDNPRVSGWLAGPSSISDASDDDIVAVVGSSLADPHAAPGSPDDLRITASLLPGGIEVVGAYVHAQPGTDPHGEAEALLHSVRQGCTGLRNNPSSRPFVIAVVHDGTDIAFFAHPRGLFGAGDLPRGAVTAEVLPEDWLETRYALLRCGGWAVDATEDAFDAAAKEATSCAIAFVVDTALDEDAVEATGRIGGGGKGGGKKGKKGGGKGRGGGAGGGGGGGDDAKPASKAVMGLGGTGDDATLDDIIGFQVSGAIVEATPVARTSAGISTGDHSASVAPLPAPSFAFRPDAGDATQAAPTTCGYVAHVDALVYTPRSATLGQVAAALRASVASRVAELRVRSVSSSSTSSSTSASDAPRCLHFTPPGVGHAVSLVYPLGGASDVDVGENPDRILDRRLRSLHRRLGLPLDRPMLREANALGAFGSDTGDRSTQTRRLRDVHTMGLPKSRVDGGAAFEVEGSYDYYHYGQDRVDDAGWGCAYRSCQTICSWFKLQHYTHVPVPSHVDMQRCLHRIGDKDGDFAGSRRWIGAVELSYVLDELLGVTCKILNVPSGHDMPSYARELAHHFHTMGTPCMMGGGQLAYALLGVDWNEKTGECAFLILDPHYAEGEDAGKIIPRWCGWKRCEEVFVKEFYNVLLPQRPTSV